MASVVYACGVLLYKFDGTAYAAAQSVGASILYNRETNTSAILLYDQQKKPVCVATITLDTYYRITSDVYIALKDDMRQLWSIGFTKQEDQHHFSSCVLLCQRTYPLTGKKIIKLQLPTQAVPNAKTVTAGEYVAIDYNCNEINNANPHALGITLAQSKPGEPLSFKVGSGSVAKVFEEALVGMKKGEKYYIIVPPLEPSKKKKKKVDLPNEKALFFLVTINDTFTTAQEIKQTLKSKKEKNANKEELVQKLQPKEVIPLAESSEKKIVSHVEVTPKSLDTQKDGKEQKNYFTKCKYLWRRKRCPFAYNV